MPVFPSQHLTSLCLGCNLLTRLDVSVLPSLRELRCPRNKLSTLAVHGALLTALDAQHNGEAQHFGELQHYGEAQNFREAQGATLP